MDGSDRRCDRFVNSQSLMSLAAVSADQEERIVDPDAETDHRGEGRRDRRHGRRVAQEADQGEADEQADDCGDDRQAHSNERSEGEREDDHRRNQADHFAALRRRLRELASDGSTGRDVHAGRSSRIGRIDDLLGDFVRQLVAADVE